MNTNEDEARQLYEAGLRDRIACRLLEETGRAPHETLGFLAQQACEKFLKSRLVLAGVPPGRTHDLEFLAGQICTAGIDLPISIDDLRLLNPYAVAFRYEPSPGRWIDERLALELVEALRVITEGALRQVGEDASMWGRQAGDHID